jgi:hypothetical protein
VNCPELDQALEIYQRMLVKRGADNSRESVEDSGDTGEAFQEEGEWRQPPSCCGCIFSISPPRFGLRPRESTRHTRTPSDPGPRPQGGSSHSLSVRQSIGRPASSSGTGTHSYISPTASSSAKQSLTPNRTATSSPFSRLFGTRTVSTPSTTPSSCQAGKRTLSTPATSKKTKPNTPETPTRPRVRKFAISAPTNPPRSIGATANLFYGARTLTSDSLAHNDPSALLHLHSQPSSQTRSLIRTGQSSPPSATRSPILVPKLLQNPSPTSPSPSQRLRRVSVHLSDLHNSLRSQSSDDPTSPPSNSTQHKSTGAELQAPPVPTLSMPMPISSPQLIGPMNVLTVRNLHTDFNLSQEQKMAGVRLQSSRDVGIPFPRDT